MIPAARAALERVGGATLLLTQSRGDETQCTRHALEHGATTIVVLGGDGTISQVACELVRQQSTVPLAIFGAGTGNDFAKSLRAPIHDFGAMATLIAARSMRTIDAGRVDHDIFVNSAGFGFDAEVVAITTQPGLVTGKLRYVATALQQLFQYRGFHARVSHGDADIASSVRPDAPRNQHSANGDHTARWLTLVFANGGWFGGAFHIAPMASVSDGHLDSVFVRDTPAWRRIAIFGRAITGQHTAQPEVGIGRNIWWTIEFSAPPVYQADGELRQAASNTVTVSVLPASLRIISPVPY